MARYLIDRAPGPIEIIYTGLRAGEKLHEELFGDGERDIRPTHPLISHVDVPPLRPSAARALEVYADPDHLIPDLARLSRVGTTTPVRATPPVTPAGPVATPVATPVAAGVVGSRPG